MLELAAASRDGQSLSCSVEPGQSVMEAFRHAGLDELLALCGGSCACATCHVYVEDATASILAPIGEDEKDLLEASDHFQANSRLSCQLVATDVSGRLSVRIAPED